jgi:hypothetical protein
MSGLEHVSEHLVKQYTGAYGPFVSGDYAIGEQIKTPYTTGEVIWSYRAPLHGLTYVVDDATGWPTEVLANEVQA